MRLARAVFFFACACSNAASVADAGHDANDNDAIDGAIACIPTGTWSGPIDNVAFPSGSGAVTLALSQNGNAIAGTVTFGKGLPPPAPTDPNAVYPPNLAVSALQQPMPNDYVEGFVFTIENGTFDGSRLQFGVVAEDVFAAYCALQPQTWADGSDGGAPYACLPPWGFFCNGQTEMCTSTNPNDSSQTITYSVEKQDLCSPGATCICNATTCAVTTTPDIAFDMTCTNGAFSGTIAGALGSHAVSVAR